MKNKKDFEALIEYNNSYPNGVPYISIVMSTFNKASLLDKTLASIRANETDIPYEIIVVDDGSTDNTSNVCKKHSAIYVWLEGGGYRSPSIPRNIGCRTARGKILIMQSDEILHESIDVIAKLADVKRGEVHFATVWNYHNGKRLQNYCSPENPTPHFFLGSMFKEDFWSIGGNDEDFTATGYEDTYLGEIIKRKYKAEWRHDVVGLHQDHPRPKNLGQLITPSRELYEKKMRELE